MTLRAGGRVDTADIRRRYPLVEVFARYGVAPRRVGRRPVARCPFHDDHEPSLVLYLDDPADEHFHCFGCGAHGDVIRFVELIERLPFRAAVAALAGVTVAAPPGDRRPPRRTGCPRGPRTPADRACLATAIDLYHRRLLRDPAALAYCADRGLDLAALVRHRLGYAPHGGADELAAVLRREGVPPAVARRMGLLDRRGREFLAGRIVIPEMRAGDPVWAIGRRLGEAEAGPRYLGLPGVKPLLGVEEARARRAVYVTEGPFDRLTLSRWGLPALALAGTRARPEALAILSRFPRIYLVLDNDEAGRQATAALRRALGARAVPVPLRGVKDVADLGRCPDGRERFLRAVGREVGGESARAA